MKRAEPRDLKPTSALDPSPSTSIISEPAPSAPPTCRYTDETTHRLTTQINPTNDSEARLNSANQSAENQGARTNEMSMLGGGFDAIGYDSCQQQPVSYRGSKKQRDTSSAYLHRTFKTVFIVYLINFSLLILFYGNRILFIYAYTIFTRPVRRPASKNANRRPLAFASEKRCG